MLSLHVYIKHLRSLVFYTRVDCLYVDVYAYLRMAVKQYVQSYSPDNDAVERASDAQAAFQT